MLFKSRINYRTTVKVKVLKIFNSFCLGKLWGLLKFLEINHFDPRVLMEAI